jgi:hypothetical protein
MSPASTHHQGANGWLGATASLVTAYWADIWRVLRGG